MQRQLGFCWIWWKFGRNPCRFDRLALNYSYRYDGLPEASCQFKILWQFNFYGITSKYYKHTYNHIYDCEKHQTHWMAHCRIRLSISNYWLYWLRFELENNIFASDFFSSFICKHFLWTFNLLFFSTKTLHFLRKDSKSKSTSMTSTLLTSHAYVWALCASVERVHTLARSHDWQDVVDEYYHGHGAFTAWKQWEGVF